VIFPLRQGILATLPKDLNMLEYNDGLGTAYAVSEDWIRECDDSDRVVPLGDFLVRAGKGEAAQRGATTERPTLQPSKRHPEGIQANMDKRGRATSSSGAENHIRLDNDPQHDVSDGHREEIEGHQTGMRT
jgi:hypothetical protein